MAYGSAAAYSPNSDAPYFVDFPVDWQTGLLRPEVAERWLAADPFRTAGSRVEALRQLDRLMLESGELDEYGSRFAVQSMADKLGELGIGYERRLFGGRHSDDSVRRVAEAIAWSVSTATI